MAEHKWPARESIRELEHNAWIVGDRFIIAKTQQQGPGCWGDGEGSFFTTLPYIPSDGKFLNLPTAHPFPPLRIHYDDRAVWQVGDAVLKVINMDEPTCTREHVTMEAVGQRNVDFNVPKVFFHGEWDRRYYLIMSRAPGQSLNEAWLSMDDEMKGRWVTRVANICADLASWEGSEMTGVDGNELSEHYLAPGRYNKDFSPANLLRSCQAMEMDCSKLVFYHCDLGPGNIFLDSDSGNLSIIDWETAGFVPKAWVSTKPQVSPGLDLENSDTERNPECRWEWRRALRQKLSDMGFPAIGETFVKWMRAAN